MTRTYSIVTDVDSEESAKFREHATRVKMYADRANTYVMQHSSARYSDVYNVAMMYAREYTSDFFVLIVEEDEEHARYVYFHNAREVTEDERNALLYT